MSDREPDPSAYAHTVMVLGWLGGVVAFFSTWYAAASEYGFIVGFLLGWIPAYIAAIMVFFTALIWVPLLGLVALWLGYLAMTR